MSSTIHTDEIDGDEETQFMKKLDYLKSHSEVYLRMLNDMRRRLKELPANSPTSQQYRSVHAANVVYHLVSHPHILKSMASFESMAVTFSIPIVLQYMIYSFPT